jgi:hypothetical protein
MGAKDSAPVSIDRISRVRPNFVSPENAIRTQREAIATMMANANNSRLSPAQRQALIANLSVAGLKGIQDTRLNYDNTNAGISNAVASQNANIEGQNIGYDLQEQQLEFANNATKQMFTSKGIEGLGTTLAGAGAGLNKKQQSLDLYEMFKNNPEWFDMIFDKSGNVSVSYKGK